MTPLEILGRRIGPGEPTYVIAEISANHNGRFEEAVRLLELAREAGADAVKIQTYTPETMTVDADAEPFRIESTIWDGRNLFELYEEAQTPWEWQPRLRDAAAEQGLHLFSSAYDASSVGFLEEIGMPAYKIASFELVDLPLIRRVAETGKPTIMSTGMGTLEEIDEAVAAFREAGGEQLALLKCTSAYPSPVSDMNLRSMPVLGRRYEVPFGLSDHTLAHAASVAAVALGASLLEKHLTASRDAPGPDQAFSLEPGEFAELIALVRDAERALGSTEIGPAPAEEATRRFRRSLFIVADMRAGERFTLENVRSIRPADGLHPRHLADVVGARATRDVRRGTPLDWSLVERA